MRSSVEQECFRLIQQIAVTQHPFCVRCGQPSTCGHHIYTRSRPATAFDPEAVLGVCVICHDHIERHPEEGTQLAINVIGWGKYVFLEGKSRNYCGYRIEDFREIRQGLRQRLKEMEEYGRRQDTFTACFSIG